MSTPTRPRLSRNRLRAARLAAALLCGSFIATSATAANSNWNAGGSNTNWSNNDNWSAGAPGKVWDPLEPYPLNRDEVILTRAVALANRTITLDETRQIGRLILSNTGALGNGVYTINATGGSVLRLAGSTTPETIPTMSGNWNVGSLQLVVNPAIVLEASSPSENQLHHFSFDSHVEFHGALSGGTTSGQITLVSDNNRTNGHVKFLGPISDGGAAGGLALTFSGGSHGTISGDNTFTGGVTLDLSTGGSFLTIGHNNALGTGTLHLNRGGITGSGGRTISNHVILGQSTSFTNTGGLTFSGPLELASGSDPYSISVNAGTINFNGVVSDADDSARAILKTGAGNINFTNANTFAGGIEIRGGTLQTSHAQGFGTGTIVLNGAGITFIAQNLTIANDMVWKSGVNFTNTQGLNLSGDITLDYGAERFATYVNTGTVTLSGVISDGEVPTGPDPIPAPPRLVKTSGGTLALTNANTFSGGIEIQGGTVRAEHAQALGVGTIVLNGGTLAGTQRITNDIEALSTILITGATGFDVAGDIHLKGSTAQQGMSLDTAGTLLISGSFKDGDTAKGIKISGRNSVLILSGDNELSGGIELAPQSGGNNNFGLGLGHARALGTGALIIDAVLAGTGVVNLFNDTAEALTLTTNNAQEWRSNFSVGKTGYLAALHMGSGAVTLGKTVEITLARNTTFGVGGNIGHGETAYGLNVYGSGDINGGGMLVLGGNNTFEGDLNLAGQGTRLAINHNGALGQGSLIINNVWVKLDNTSGAAVVNTRANNQEWHHHFEFIGSNDLDLGTGSVDLGDRTTGAGAAVQREITVSGSKLTVGGTINNGSNGITTGIIKLGAGELALMGDNTFNGALRVNAGTVTLGGTNDLSLVELNQGRLNINRDGAVSEWSGGVHLLKNANEKTLGNTSGNAVTTTLASSNDWNRGFNFIGTGDLTLQGGDVTFNWANHESGVFNVQGAALTFRTQITSGAGAKTLEKTGSGTLAFVLEEGMTSAQYSGKTLINGGTVRLQADTVDAAFGFSTGGIDIGSGSTFDVSVAQGAGHLERNIRVTGSGGTYQLERAWNEAYNAYTLSSAIDATGARNTVAALLDGTAQDTTVVKGSFSLSAGTPLANDGNRVSDVFSLSGTDGTIFVLQLQVTLADVGDDDLFFLGWADGGQWVNAIDGNSETGALAQYYSTSYDLAGISADSLYLGSWGFDRASGSVWAVLDHNSDFSVVFDAPVIPEPSTFALLGAAAAFLGFERLRCRRRRA